MDRRLEIFGGGRPVCVAREALVLEVADDDQKVIIGDLRGDEAAATLVAERGIKAAPAVVVDGRLLGCCNNAVADHAELEAAGVGPPTG